MRPAFLTLLLFHLFHFFTFLLFPCVPHLVQFFLDLRYQGFYAALNLLVLSVGKRLVQVAIQWARDVGATRTELGVYEFNESARAFWESVGFETLSRRLVVQLSNSP